MTWLLVRSSCEKVLSHIVRRTWYLVMKKNNKNNLLPVEFVRVLMSCCLLLRPIVRYGQNPLHQFSPQQVRNKSATSWRGQKSVVSVLSCRVKLSTSQIPLQRLVVNKLTTSPFTGKLRGNVSNRFWALVIRLSRWWCSVIINFRSDSCRCIVIAPCR